MDPDRWRRIEGLYQSAAERKPEERDAFLAAACGGDEELRREVESLLAQQSIDTPLDHPAMDLAAGSRLGPYELLEPIGHGGMGAVFKARDTRLNRNVAIKVSTAQFSGRFANEARAVAALNHPNICILHDVGPNYLVMELVEGENLAEHIRKGPLPLNETLRHGAEIADAAAAAHAHGIIHRDLKPANIMLTKSGVKVLDFGLAKFETPPDPGQALTASQAVIGTVAYMSPEQAEGKVVDARSDIFSLGTVLYEMVTGKRPFQRGSEVATLAAILHEEPEPLSKAALGAPTELVRIIERCMRKDPERRFQHADEVRVELEELRTESQADRSRRVKLPQIVRRRLWPWGVAVLATALLPVAFQTWQGREKVQPEDLKPVALTAYSGAEAGPSFSADGNKVAFEWNGEQEKNADIYVKQIGTTGPPMRLTSGPEAECCAAWSPDDRWIAFLRQQQGGWAIMLVPPLGGPVRKLTDITNRRSLSWTPDARWVAFSTQDSPTGTSSIWAISVDTLERRRLTTFLTSSANVSAVTPLGDQQQSISPDGRTLAFSRQAKAYVLELYVLRLTENLYPAGEPSRVTDQQYARINGIAWTADSREIVYSDSSSLWRVPSAGAQPPRRLPYAFRGAHGPAVARNAPRLAYTWSAGETNLWRLDVRKGERKQLIGSSGGNGWPQYSPDGHKIAFASTRSGHLEVWTCDSEGANCQQLTSFNGPMLGSPRWSPDGRWLAFDCARGQFEIYVISADGGAPRNVTNHPADEVAPSWSHDGRWLYFASDRSGRYEVWKMPTDGGSAVQVTRAGGGKVFESPDGKYVYYTKGAASGTMPLFRSPVDGGEEVQVLPRASYFAVTTKGVYFNSGVSSERTIQFLDTATGKVRTLATADKYPMHPCASPDDAYILWSQTDKSIQDLMLVEGFR